MWKKQSSPFCIKVGARASPLSRAQVAEVYAELIQRAPTLVFETHFIPTACDKDKVRSLRTLSKSDDFFTHELDLLQLAGAFELAIHSAKDLPEPLRHGLEVAALTRGVDGSDVLVLRPEEDFWSLPSGARIATSSERREESVRTLRSDLLFVDLRGTIGERLERLFRKEVDGVVLAKAALIRLELTHLPMLLLPGETTPLQGRLALVVRKGDEELKAFLHPLHDG